MNTTIINAESNPSLWKNNEQPNNNSNPKSIEKIVKYFDLSKSNYKFSEYMKEAEQEKENEECLYDDAIPTENENKIKKLKWEKSLHFLKKIKNSYFILVYENNIQISDNELHKKKKLNIEEILINNVCIREQNETIILCTKNSTKLLAFNNGELISEENILEKASYSCAQISKDDVIICEEKGVFHYSTLFDITNEDKTPKTITDKSYRGAIAISENLVAITSNKNIDNGEDKLLIYNIYPNSIVGEIIGYSFNHHSNGLAVISNKKNKNKILLCSCKKNDKNGILYIYIEKDNPKFIEHFIDTNNFEVYCFSKLYIKVNKLFNYNNEENATDYILVGGFNQNKNQGSIKVYKAEDNEITLTKNPYYDGIIKESKSPVNNIIQNENNKKIIIGNLDGCIYLVDTPDINDNE